MEERNIAGRKVVIMCDTHPKLQADIYCTSRSCNRAICSMCLKQEHKDHEWLHIIELAESMKNGVNIEQEGFMSGNNYEEGIKQLLIFFEEAKGYYINLKEILNTCVDTKIKKLSDLEKDYKKLLSDAIKPSGRMSKIEKIKKFKGEMEICIDKCDYENILKIKEERDLVNLRIKAVFSTEAFKSKVEGKVMEIQGIAEKLAIMLQEHPELETETFEEAGPLDLPTHLFSITSDSTLKIFDVLDQSTRVGHIADLPLISPEMIEVQGRIYCIGDKKGMMRETFSISIESLELRKQADMKRAKSQCHLVHLSPYIYSIGGLFNGKVGGYCEKYHRAKDSWGVMPYLNTPKFVVGGCVFQNRYIYIFGGSVKGGKDCMGGVEKLDCHNERVGWQVLTLPGDADWTPRYWVAAVHVPNMGILVFGGYSGTKENSAYMFKTGSGDRGFRPLSAMKTPGYFNFGRSNTCVVRSHLVYGLDQSNVIHIYDTQGNTWQAMNLEL